jgi:hypothetical protein
MSQAKKTQVHRVCARRRLARRVTLYGFISHQREKTERPIGRSHGGPIDRNKPNFIRSWSGKWRPADAPDHKIDSGHRMNQQTLLIHCSFWSSRLSRRLCGCPTIVEQASQSLNKGKDIVKKQKKDEDAKMMRMGIGQTVRGVYQK